MRILLATLSAFIPSVALACSCIPPGEVTADALENAVVFRGVPVNSETAQKTKTFEDGRTVHFSGLEALTTFEIRHLYHASDDAPLLPDDTITLSHATSSAACGRMFATGQSTFVIATLWRGKWQTSTCAPFTEAAMVRYLDGEAPLPATDPEIPCGEPSPPG